MGGSAGLSGGAEGTNPACSVAVGAPPALPSSMRRKAASGLQRTPDASIAFVPPGRPFYPCQIRILEQIDTQGRLLHGRIRLVSAVAPTSAPTDWSMPERRRNAMPKHKVAMLTAGGLAPCLSSAVAELIGRYTELAPEAEMIGYLDGYAGLLQGESLAVTPAVRAARQYPACAWRLADRQQPRQAHQRRRLREARPRQGGRDPAAGRRRAADRATASPSSIRSAATTLPPPPPTSRNISPTTATS